MNRHAGRVAVVTGGARGLGRGAADRLVADGARVVVFDVVDGVDLPLTGADRLTDAPLAGLRVDVTDDDALRAAVAAVVTVLGGLDVLVAGAGVAVPPTPLLDAEAADIERVLAVNVRGVIATLRAGLAPMVRAGAGRVVVISSQTGRRPWAEWGVYSGSKAFAAALAQSAALEYAPHGIRINVLCPGTMESDMMRTAFGYRAARTGRAVDDEIRAHARTIPVGRVGTPADVGAAVSWLVSDDAEFVTGASLDLSGGELVML